MPQRQGNGAARRLGWVSRFGLGRNHDIGRRRLGLSWTGPVAALLAFSVLALAAAAQADGNRSAGVRQRTSASAGTVVFVSPSGDRTAQTTGQAGAGSRKQTEGSPKGAAGVPNVTDPQGDQLVVSPPWVAYTTGNLQSASIFCGQHLTSAYGGELIGFCAPLTFHDSVTGAQVPGTNSGWTHVYDACGALVATHTEGSETDTGQNYLTMPAWAGGPVIIPASGVCWGQWTATVSFTETFTDQQQLTDSNSYIFPVTAVPPPPPPPPPTAYAVGTAQASVHSPTCNSADPVNCASGNFSETFDDASVPGRGPGLDLTRTYNSLSASTAGIFGYGWSSSYDAHVTQNTDGSATVTEADGSQVTAAPAGGGAFTVPSWANSSLTENGDGSWTFVRRQQTTYGFDSLGRLTSISDLNGYATRLAYNGSGQLSTVTDPAGRAITFTFGSNGFVSQVSDPASQATLYGYDSSGNLTSVTDPMNRVTSFTYDGSQRLLTMTDPNQGVTTNVYDSSGRVTKQTDPAQLVTTFAYSGDNFSANSGTTTVTDPHGNVTVEGYTNGVMLSLTKGAGTAAAATWQFSYDPNTYGVTSVTDPNNHTTSSTYDGAGNLLTSTDPLNRKTTYTYNSFDEPLTVTDPAGIKSTYTYDPNGNIQTRTVAGVGGSPSEATTYSYTDGHAGDLTVISDPAGHVTDYTYDAQGDVATTTTHPASGVSDTTAFVYDTLARKICEASPQATAASVQCPPAGQPRVDDTTTWSYDPDGEVTSSIDPLGNTTAYVYDNDGNQTQTTDPAGHVTKTVLDADSRIQSQTSGYGSAAAATTSYVYDLVPGTGTCSGSVATATYCSTVTDPSGATTVDYANSRDQRIEETQPSSGTSLSTYDPAGNLATLTTAGGKASYGYDAGNELTSVTYSNPASGFAAAPNVTYTYDTDGKRKTMADGTGTSTYTYDALERLQSTTNGAGSTVGYGYDLDNEVTSITYPGHSQPVTQSWDGAGREASVGDWLSHTTTFSYDANDNLNSAAYPNATTVSSTYDHADDLLTTKQATNANPNNPFASFAYTYNADSQVQTETDTGTPAPSSQSYVYDPLNRLTSSSSASYGYDSSSDPIQLGSLTQAFTSAHQLTSQAANITRVGANKAGDNGSGSSLNLTLPSGTAANDQILLTVTLPGNQSIKSTPSGYTLVGTYSSGTGASNVQLAVYRRTAQTGDTSVTITFSKTFAKAATVTVYRGVNPVTPIDANTGAPPTVSGTTITAPSLTTTKPNDELVFADGAESSTAGTWTAPSQMTTAQNNPAGAPTIAASIADQTLTAAGATGTRTATYSTTGSLAAAVIALQPAQTTYSYDSLGDRKTATTPTGTTTLSYDQLGRTTAYGSTTYAYNGDGLRTAKTTGRTTEPFTWQPQGPTGSPSILVDGSTDYLYGPDGLPLEQITGSTALYYLHDALGSTRALTNSTGTVTATSTYGAYGNLASSTGTSTNPFGYADSYTDPESGLLHLQHRYYDPATAQFSSVDPLVNTTQAAYNYAAADPTNQTDPTGLGGGLLGTVENYSVGLVDTATLGLTRKARNLLGGDNINYCSTAYRTGSATGLAVGLAIPGEGEAEAAIAAEETASEGGLIFRGGTQTDNALTDKGTGLSFRNSLSNSVDGPAVLRPGEKYFAVDTSKLSPGSVVRDNVPPGHVSVNGLTPDQIRQAIVDPQGDPFLGGKFPR